MRNTTFKFFVSFLALFALAFVLAGCSKHEHTFGEWKETKAPTCTEAGEETRFCDCGEKQTVSIGALGHEFLQDECLKCGEKIEYTPETCPHYHHEIVKGKPATCTEDGLTDGKKCSVCEEVTLEQEVITAPGHNYVDGVCDSCGEIKPSEGLSFVTNGDGTCYVSGIGTCTDTDIVIPKVSPEGDSVTSIGDRTFYSCDSLTSVVIGDSVTSIGYMAFYNCSSLESVVIPDSVTSIGDRAFYSCDSLTSVVIPDSVTSIGDWAFYNCSSLESVVIPDSVTSISYMAFYNCSSLESVVIPDSVTSIGYMAFYNCSSLESVVIPDSVTSIGEYAFCVCTSIESVVIPDSVTSIGNRAFYSCDSLTSVVIGDSVTSIGDLTFYCCTSLVNIEVSPGNSNYESIDGNLYTKGGITLIQYAIGKTATSFTIPDSVESIGNFAFFNCSSLESVVIPDSVTSIGRYMFRGCSSLESVVIGNGVTSIGDSAFSDCTSLTSVVIGDSVTSIGDWAFSYCDSLESVVVPDSVTSIGNAAFSYCDSLESVVVHDSVTSIGNAAFSYCDSLVNIEVSPGNSNYESIDGNLYTKGGITLIQYAIGKDETNFTILDSVTIIGYTAFADCTSLESVVIPDSVTSIGYEAFYHCSSLVSVVIPDSVTSIGESAFENCTSLVNIEVSPDNSNYESIDGNLYTKGGITLIQYAIGKTATSFTIPDSVTSIGEMAFYWCDSLESVVIGDSVTSIGEMAFTWCVSLRDVYYTGTEEEWRQISISSYGNDRLTNATKHFGYVPEE